MLDNNMRRVPVTEQTPQGERATAVISTIDVISDMREQPWSWQTEFRAIGSSNGCRLNIEAQHWERRRCVNACCSGDT
jgi:hypothetical protein